MDLIKRIQELESSINEKFVNKGNSHTYYLVYKFISQFFFCFTNSLTKKYPVSIIPTGYYFILYIII